MATPKEKDTVLNPLTLRNNVGEELLDILEAHAITNPEKFVGIKNLRNKEKLSDRVLHTVAKKMNFPEIVDYLTSFQEEYLKEKPRYKENYEKAKKTYSQLKGVIPYLRSDFTQGYDKLEDIFDFFGADTEKEVFAAAREQAALFRRQSKSDINPINLYGWLRRGELDFKSMKLGSYDEKKLKDWISSKEWLKHVEDVEYFKTLPTILKKFGVGLVLTHSLPKTVYGAVRWFEGNPLIQVSDYGKDLATCWFTLFHEIGHVINHKNAPAYEADINNGNNDKKERVANKFANEYLFNGDDLRKAVFDRKHSGKDMSIEELAKEFDVLPIFTAYWLIKAQYKPKQQQKHRFHIEFSC